MFVFRSIVFFDALLDLPNTLLLQFFNREDLRYDIDLHRFFSPILSIPLPALVDLT